MINFCEYCIPARQKNVRRDASKNTRDPNQRFDVNQYLPKGAACQLKRFNDGKELPKETLKGRTDVTCVGLDDPTCPKIQGFVLVDTIVYLNNINSMNEEYPMRTQVARKASSST